STALEPVFGLPASAELPREVGLGAAGGAGERLDHDGRAAERSGDLLDRPAPAAQRDRGPRGAHVAREDRGQGHRGPGGEQTVERLEGAGAGAALDRAREVEDVVEPLLADDRADVLDADVAVVGPTGQGRLSRLSQERGRVLTRQLDEEPRGLVGD